jgi:ComF family protein
MINFWERLANTISPRACAICGCRLTLGEAPICAVCNLGLPRTRYAEDPYENEMAKLFWGRIPIERCAAFFFYRAGSGPSNVIYHLKYHGQPEIGIMMGQIIAQEFDENNFFDGIDVLVPVPLAKERRRQRGFNQSEEIANGVGEATGIAVANKVVRRNSFVESQTHKDRWARADNVENAFQLLNAEQIKGKHVMVIDDVVTTGATICACVKELIKAGDVKISVLSIGFAKS